MLVTEPLALAQRSGLCVAGDCRLLLHLAPDTSLHALRLVNKHSSRGRGTLTAARYSLLRGCDPPLEVSSPPSHANEQSSRRHAIVLAGPLWRLFFGGRTDLEKLQVLDWGYRSTKSSFGRNDAAY